MSILKPIRASSAPARISTRSRSATADDAVLRGTAVVSLLAIGVIHFLQIVPTFQATPLLGVAFVMLIAAAVGVAARLSTHNDRGAWVTSSLVAGAAIGGYAFTRVFGTPLDRQDVGNWSCMLGLAALFVETTAVAISANAAVTASPLRRAIAGPRTVESQVDTAAGNPSAA